MKTVSTVFACVLGFAVALPVAAEGLALNVGVVSLYKSNGIDADKRSPKAFVPALQGSAEYGFASGFYVGAWGSTVKTGNASAEVDLYGGYRGAITSDLTYDLGVTRYVYTGDSTLNSNEWYGALTYGMVTARYARAFGNGNRNARLGLALAYPLTDTVTLTAGVGFRNSTNSSGANDYSVGAAYSLGDGWTATATLSGAETSKVGASGRGRLVVGLNKSL